MKKKKNEPKFDNILQLARDDPTSTAGKKAVQDILDAFSPLIRTIGAKIPWNPLERKSALSHLYAMTQTYGLC